MRLYFQLCFPILLLFSCKTKSKDADTKMPPPRPVTNVEVIIAKPQSLSGTVEANGTVIAAESVELKSEINGRITYLHIPEGKTIARGTVIARINDADIKAQIQKSRAQLALAEKTAERFKKLADIGGLSQSEYDVAVSEIATIKAEINYQYAQLEKTVIKAPFSGVVGLRNVSAGAYVSPSTVLATLQKTTEVNIDFTLPQTFVSSIKTGLKVKVVTADNRELNATIIAIEPLVEASTRNVKVRATLNNAAISPGAFVKVYIQTDDNKPVILVPANAIIPESNGKKLIVVKAGKAELVTIETGVRKEALVAVKDGIETGDSVVVSGVLFAKPGAPVNVKAVVDIEKFK